LLHTQEDEMTDRARPTPTADDHPIMPIEAVIPLPGFNPLTVYVRMTSGNPEFSTNGTAWGSDMSWQCGTEYALYIMFILLTPGIELTPKLSGPTIWFSPVQTDPNQRRYQWGCANPVTTQTPFSFYAGAPGALRDPQIVVTPINGDPDDCDPPRVGRA